MIEGKLLDPDGADQRVTLSAVEEWPITNRDERNDHVLHTHVNPFQLTQVNGRSVDTVWLDTVPVPHGGSITIRTRFLDFSGRTVLHCHMINHEELGMMQVWRYRIAGKSYEPPVRSSAVGAFSRGQVPGKEVSRG